MRQARAASRRGTSGANAERVLEADEALKRGDVADAGEHDPEDAGVLHDGERLGRARRHDQPAHLLADALGRQVAQPLARADRRREPLAVDVAGAVLGVEAEEAEDAQPVLGDPPVGLADEADATGEQVRIAAERIVDQCRAGRPRARSS